MEAEGDLEGKILDPCAGGDVNHFMSYPESLKKCGNENIESLDNTFILFKILR